MSKNKPTYKELEKRVRELESRIIKQEISLKNGHLTEEQFSIVSDNLPGMVYQFVLHKDGSFSIPYISKQVALYSGFKPDEIQSTPELLFKPIHPDDIEIVNIAIEESARTLESCKFEHRLISKDGSVTWFLVKSIPRILESGDILWNGISIDITESKQAERELERMFNLTDFMTCIADINNFHFLKLSPAFEDKLGYSSEEMLNKSFMDFVHPDDKQITLDVVKEELEKGKEVIGFDNRYRCKDGSYKWLAWTSRPVVEEGITFAMAYDITDRKKAQADLRKSEEFLQHVIESTTDAIWDWNVRTGETYFSSRWFTMLGYQAFEMPSSYQTWESLLHPDDKERTIGTVRKHLEKNIGPFSIEFRMKMKNGGWKWLLGRGHTVEFDSENKPLRMVGSHIDISERKQVEEVLRKEKEFTEIALNAQLDTFFLFETETGKAIRWNQAFNNISGYTDEEIAAMPATAMSYFSPEDFIRASNFNLEVIENGTGTIELDLICKNGHKVPTEYKVSVIEDKQGKPKYFVSIGRDITDRKKIEEALLSEKHFIDLAIDSLPGIFYLFTIEGKFLRWNRNFETSSGYSGEEISQMHPRDFFPVEEQSLVEERIREVFTKGESAVEANWLSKDGTKTFYFLTGVRVDINDTPCQVGMGINITERRQLEEERNRAGKLESIGVLAGGIAHDFNNILTAIMGNISLANMFADEDIKKAKDILYEAEKASLRAKDLTQQLLTFSKGGEPVKKATPLRELIKDSVSFSLRGSKSKSKINIQKKLWIAEVDEGQINQVINNIIINADQAMPQGGTISVRVINVAIDSDNLLPLVEGKYIRITIKDQGTGVAKEHLSMIFDPYFTTKQKGSGLGLATCYSIISKHGGHIDVESKLDVGTTFHIYLPASSGQVEAMGHGKKEDTTVNAGKILVMDDEQVVLDVASRLLEHIGCEVECAVNGTDAIKKYRKAINSDKPFVVVILDLTIPGGLGGKDTMARLLEIDPEVNAIVSSGYSNDPVMANYRDYGFSSVVSKPYRIGELRKVLQSVLKEKSD